MSLSQEDIFKFIVLSIMSFGQIAIFAFWWWTEKSE